MHDFPCEIWREIAGYLRRPAPPPGQPGTTWKHTHQQALTTMMRVSSAAQEGAAAVLYSYVVISDLSKLFVGVDAPRTDLAYRTLGLFSELPFPADETHDEAAPQTPPPIHKIALLARVNAISYVYPAPIFHWGHFLESNQAIQWSKTSLQGLFPALARQIFNGWVVEAYQSGHQELIGETSQDDQSTFQQAQYDFDRQAILPAHHDGQLAASMPVPLARYRCVTSGNGGPLDHGEIGRRWPVCANLSDETSPRCINVVHDVNIFARPEIRHLVPGAVNHIYVDPDTVRDEPVAAQIHPDMLLHLVHSFGQRRSNWRSDHNVSHHELDSTTLVIFLPRPRMSWRVSPGYAADNDDLEPMNQELSRLEEQYRAQKRLSARKDCDPQQIRFAWIEEEPWCLACGKINLHMTGLGDTTTISSPGKASIISVDLPDTSTEDESFFDFGTSGEDDESEEEEDE